MNIGPARILHVDDDSGVRATISALLSHVGYIVESAADGLDAWEKLKGDFDGFNLVITDYQMPFLDGGELVKKLRAHSFAGAIIVFTASLDEAVNSLFSQLRVDAVVPKGTTAQSLLSAVRKVLA